MPMNESVDVYGPNGVDPDADAGRSSAHGPLSPPLVPLDESLAKLRLVRKSGGRRCPRGSPASCGCSGLAACSLMGRDVTTDDCYTCLTTGPRAHEGL